MLIQLLAPHTSGPRDVPRCGALSIQQKPLHYRGGSAEIAPTPNVKLWDPVTGGGDHGDDIPGFLNSQSTEIKSRRGAGRFTSIIYTKENLAIRGPAKFC